MLFSGDIEGAVDLWLARTKIDPSPIDLGNAAFATAYSGDIAAARRLAADARAQADESGSLTCIAWTAYATGEIEHVAGSGDQVAWLEMAVEHATVVGSDFTVGVAQLSLATTEAAAGAVADAAATYHSLIEHWLRSGTWTQQWTTLRNVATLLEDSAPATALALIVGADRDEFSPALTPTAEEECRRLRDRLVLALGPDRAQAAEIEGKRASRTELADAARVALRLLMAEAERSELPQDSHR